ncbi:MAG TPA: hypothetical protein VFX03_06865, partial [Thermomicrobiales bacterium]|nr:hypothetical protein [Thermomicrobiales bacterium]
MDFFTLLNFPRTSTARRRTAATTRRPSRSRLSSKRLRNRAGSFVESLEPRALLSAVAWNVLS